MKMENIATVATRARDSRVCHPSWSLGTTRKGLVGELSVDGNSTTGMSWCKTDAGRLEYRELARCEIRQERGSKF
jgi:hypothetical protein